VTFASALCRGSAAVSRDEENGPAAVIVSEEAVRRIWKGQDPVGRRIELANGSVTGSFGAWPGTIDFRSGMLAKTTIVFEVIGVARDVSEDVVQSKKHPAMYFPLRPSDYAQPSLRGVTLMVRAAPGFDAITAIRREISTIDSNVSPFNARSMIEHIGQFMSALKAASWTYGCMGFFGVVLASVGLAGVTAHSVAKRGHEIGIRMALGAQKRDVLTLVLKEGAILTAVGTAAGLALALAGIRALSGMFFAVASVQGYDPVLLAGAPLLLAGLALLACYLPARRSARIDPAVALRQE
jgi:ABC-type antimicrobial peptide transport system permease subunit